MGCPLCGAENRLSARCCEVCDSPLDQAPPPIPQEQNIVLEPEEVGDTEIRKNRVLIAIGFIALLLAPWIWMSDLLEVPHSIELSQYEYRQFRQRYLAHEEQWVEQKNQVLSSMRRHRGNDDISKQPLLFENIPLEVIYAYLRDDLNFTDKDITLHLTARDGEITVILTKREKGIWPLSILDSLEVVIELNETAFVPRFVRLRRGGRRIPEQLAFHYFEPELRKLSGLSSFQGGIRGLAFFEKEQEGQTFLSWRYQQRALNTRPGHIAADF